MDANAMDLLQPYIQVLQRMIHSEEEKFVAISQENLSRLESAMKQDEVFFVELRLLDQKRSAWQIQHGISDDQLRNIWNSPTQEPRVQDAFHQLQTLHEAYLAHSQNSKQLLELRLYHIQSILQQTQGTVPVSAAMTSSRG